MKENFIYSDLLLPECVFLIWVCVSRKWSRLNVVSQTKNDECRTISSCNIEVNSVVHHYSEWHLHFFQYCFTFRWKWSCKHVATVHVYESHKTNQICQNDWWTWPDWRITRTRESKMNLHIYICMYVLYNELSKQTWFQSSNNPIDLVFFFFFFFLIFRQNMRLLKTRLNYYNSDFHVLELLNANLAMSMEVKIHLIMT